MKSPSMRMPVYVKWDFAILTLPFLNPTFLPSGEVFRAARSGQGRVLCGASEPLTARTALPPFR